MEKMVSDIKKGFFWNTISQISSQGISLLSLIFLGRLLLPEDFGLLGMVAIFIALSDMITDSGMGGALIKKKKASDIDYSTLFWYNIAVSLLMYGILFLIAPVVSNFYDKYILTDLIRVYGLVIIIYALCITQRTRLLKQLDFRRMAVIECAGGTISLIAAILCALKGLGVWSLVVQQMIRSIVNALFLFIYNRFIPLFQFSKKSFKEQFYFGINLLGANCLQTITNNITSNVVAGITPLRQTGYFVQSNKIVNTATCFFTLIIDRTVFPILSQERDKMTLRQTYVNISKKVMTVIFLLSGIITLLSKQIIFFVLGKNWMEAAWVLQLLAFLMIPYAIQLLCRNLLKSCSKTTQIFSNEFIKTILTIISIIVSCFWGLKYIICGLIISQSIACFCIMYSVKKEINYRFWLQIKDVLSALIVYIVSCIVSFLIFNIYTTENQIVNVLFGLFLIISATLFFSFLFRQKEIFQIIKILLKIKWKHTL